MNDQHKSSEQPRIWAIVPAAGVGRRMANPCPKQYLDLYGRTVIEHSLDKLFDCPVIAGVAVGISAHDSHWADLSVQNEKLLGVYQGGAERMHTVVRGLEFISAWAAPDDWVLVHDAVRPCVSPADINRLIEQAMQSQCSAVLTAPVVDTVKSVSRHGYIEQTLNRDDLLLAATPQIFPIELLTRALKSAIQQGFVGTDESAAVERLGEQPLAVSGRRDNLKITTPEDLELAAYYFGNARQH